MIVSPRERRATPLNRLLNWAGISRKQGSRNDVYSEDQFRRELEKERSRVDRRTGASEFAVLLIAGLNIRQLLDHPHLVLDIRERLRITDSIGWCETRLGLLLPETGRRGADVVAAEFNSIARIYQLDTTVEIVVYPDDDDVAQKSLEFQSLQFRADSDDFDSGIETDIDCNAGFSRPEASGEQQINSRGSLFSKSSATPVWKRSIDIVGSSFGLVILSPLFLAAAAAVRISGSGPILFKQLREGKDGVPFFVYKFRTMCTDAEELKENLRSFSEQDGPAFKIENDPRLTPVGKYLRKSCIDELPQLFNILTGTMSLVGPRPLPVSESFECLIWQRKRLQVVPGLTCIWQVRGNRNTKFTEWMRMDMEYIRRRSFTFDIKLILQTIWVAVLHRGSV